MAYKLTHPDSDLEIERDAADVASYQRQGWQTKPGANAPVSKPEPADEQ